MGTSSFRPGHLSRRGAIKVLAGASCGIAFGTMGLAQSAFPTRPIRLVIPFAAGGVFDAIGRPWAEQASQFLGTIYIENIGGGGGTKGAAVVSRANPDGYTLLLGGTGSHVVGPLVAARKPYDPINDFSPVALLARGTFAVIANPATPIRSLTDLITQAKTSVGKYSYASPGVGSGPHLAGELLKSVAGISGVVHVPYKGAGPAMADVVSGHVQLAILSVTPQLISMHHAGKLRLLAVTSQKRLPNIPDIPTAEEFGFPEMVAENFLAVFAPKGTPDEIISRLHTASSSALVAPEMLRVLSAAGFEAITDGAPASATQFIESEIERWRPVIQAVGLRG